MKLNNLQEYIELLETYKKETYPNFDITPQQYAKNSIDLLKLDIKEFISDFKSTEKPYIFKFNKNIRDFSSLTLTSEGEIPEAYQSRFEAYKLLAREQGYQCRIETSETSEGREVAVSVY